MEWTVERGERHPLADPGVLVVRGRLHGVISPSDECQLDAPVAGFPEGARRLEGVLGRDIEIIGSVDDQDWALHERELLGWRQADVVVQRVDQALEDATRVERVVPWLPVHSLTLDAA